MACLLLTACGEPVDSGTAPTGDDPPRDTGSAQDSLPAWDWWPEQGEGVLEREESTWYQDADGDGYGDPEVSQLAVEGPQGWVRDGSDCDDGDPAVHPGAEEVCDGDDDDCDGRPDLVEVSTWYSDSDGDGWGHPAETETTCAPQVGWVQQGEDCDPSDPTVHPQAEELCDEQDQDCDGEVDEGFDADGDGYWAEACSWVDGAEQDCDDGDDSIYPEALELCEDGIDQDCNGADLHCGFAGSYDLGSADAVLQAARSSRDAGRLLELGDVDGDGANDVLIATLNSTTHGGYLAYGPITADADIESIAVPLEAGATCSGGGRSIGLGDANGDGLDDVLVGCPYSTVPGVSLLLGPVTGTADLSMGESDAFLYGDRGTYTGHGTDLADMDGDGIADIAVGAWGVSASAGAMYVEYGPVSGTTALVDDADAVLAGWGSLAYLGRQVRAGGDLDGDGISDLMVSAPYASTHGYGLGYIAVMYMPFTGTLSAEDADVLLVGESTYATLGISMAMGDLDGDGLHDMVAGASANSVTGANEGAAYVVLGGTTGAVDLGVADVIVRGTGGYDGAGSGVACAHSDGDAYAELVVGAANESSLGSYSGAAYIFYGPLSGSYITSDAHAILWGTTGSDQAGQGVAVGDMNDDGIGDVLVGANGHGSYGGVFVQFAE